MDVKPKIKITNQRCEKSFEGQARRNLHDTVLKNIEIQMGHLIQVVQVRNNTML